MSDGPARRLCDGRVHYTRARNWARRARLFVFVVSPITHRIASYYVHNIIEPRTNGAAVYNNTIRGARIHIKYNNNNNNNAARTNRVFRNMCSLFIYLIFVISRRRNQLLSGCVLSLARTLWAAPPWGRLRFIVIFGTVYRARAKRRANIFEFGTVRTLTSHKRTHTRVRMHTTTARSCPRIPVAKVFPPSQFAPYLAP